MVASERGKSKVMSDFQNLQVVLLAGGLGTRIREETSDKPKPMIEVGGKPLLWHLIKNFNTFGIKRFIVCSGYKSEIIADYFTNYQTRNNDFTISTSGKSKVHVYSNEYNLDCEITVAYTGGPEVGTGGRIFRVQKYLDTFPFFCTYGDGLSNIDLLKLYDFHKNTKKAATVTVINPSNKFGVVELDGESVLSFKEKPKVDGWVNSGFFLFERSIFNVLDSNCTLEHLPMQSLAQNNQLSAYKHLGAWQAMDTYRELQILQSEWDSGKAFWKNW